MTTFRRSPLSVAVATVAASAVVAAPSLTPLPVYPSVPSYTIELSAASVELRPLLPQRNSDSSPALPVRAQDDAVPSLRAAFPAPPLTEPAPAATDFAGAIKSTYSAIEPWVRYGFELATYAVGWVPYVGWLSGQIMIFYNFGERIVRSLVFNSADWLWGPLPLGQGLRNIAQDSWNALVQFGIDEWNFFLPPLPPLPSTAEETTTAPAQLPELLRSDVGLPDRRSRTIADADAVTAPGPDVPVDQVGGDGTEATPTHISRSEAADDASGTAPDEGPVGVRSTRTLNRNSADPRQASLKGGEAKALKQSAPSGTVATKRDGPKLRPSGDATKAHTSETSKRDSTSRAMSSSQRHSGIS